MDRKRKPFFVRPTYTGYLDINDSIETRLLHQYFIWRYWQSTLGDTKADLQAFHASFFVVSLSFCISIPSQVQNPLVPFNWFLYTFQQKELSNARNQKAVHALDEDTERCSD